MAEAQRVGQYGYDMATAPFRATNRMLTPGYDYDNVEQASRDALDASGLAITGGIGAAAMGGYPRNSIGMAGSGGKRGWFGFGRKEPPPTEPPPGYGYGRSTEEKANAAEIYASNYERIVEADARMEKARLQRAYFEESMRRRQEMQAQQEAARLAEIASQRMTRGMSDAAAQPPLTPPPNRMISGMGQAQAPLPTPSAGLPQNPMGQAQAGVQPQSFQGVQSTPPGTASPPPGGGTVGGTSGTIPPAPGGVAPGTSTAPPASQGSRQPSPVPRGVTYGKSHTEVVQPQFAAMLRQVNGPISKLDPAVRARLVGEIQRSFERAGLDVPSPQNINDRLGRTVKILRELQDTGADISDPRALRHAFGGKGTLAIGGAPMAPETDSRGQEHYRAPDGTFTSPPQ